MTPETGTREHLCELLAGIVAVGHKMQALPDEAINLNCFMYGYDASTEMISDQLDGKHPCGAVGCFSGYCAVDKRLRELGVSADPVTKEARIEGGRLVIFLYVILHGIDERVEAVIEEMFAPRLMHSIPEKREVLGRVKLLEAFIEKHGLQVDGKK